jgi:hypothetical protein
MAMNIFHNFFFMYECDVKTQIGHAYNKSTEILQTLQTCWNVTEAK